VQKQQAKMSQTLLLHEEFSAAFFFHGGAIDTPKLLM